MHRLGFNRLKGVLVSNDDTFPDFEIRLFEDKKEAILTIPSIEYLERFEFDSYSPSVLRLKNKENKLKIFIQDGFPQACIICELNTSILLVVTTFKAKKRNRQYKQPYEEYVKGVLNHHFQWLQSRKAPFSDRREDH